MTCHSQYHPLVLLKISFSVFRYVETPYTGGSCSTRVNKTGGYTYTLNFIAENIAPILSI